MSLPGQASGKTTAHRLVSVAQLEQTGLQGPHRREVMKHPVMTFDDRVPQDFAAGGILCQFNRFLHEFGGGRRDQLR